MIAGLLFLGVSLLATLTIALARAMAQKPDPSAAFQKPLNMLLTAAMGWSALVLTALAATIRFGLVQPVLAGLILLAIYRIATSADLIPYYRFGLGLGLTTLISTVLVTSQNLIVRSTL